MNHYFPMFPTNHYFLKYHLILMSLKIHLILKYHLTLKNLRFR
jgi:hypothetical protein